MQDIYQFIMGLINQGYLGLFFVCFMINMIPFLSPSNMVLAGVAAATFRAAGWSNDVWIPVGVIVAVAATLAKAVHYFVVRSSRVVLSEERLQSLESEKARVEKWGALALFLAAASPVPDDPLIVYAGLTKYSVPKFLTSYFLGKVTVTLAGAWIGGEIGSLFESIPLVLASIVLTALIVGFLMRRRYDRPVPSPVSGTE